MEKAYKYGALFGGEAVSESEIARITEEISKIGALTFDIQTTEEGWSAQCKEVPSIIAGNTNPAPNDIEIQSEIRAAIFASFDVQVEQPSPYQDSNLFKYSAQSVE